MPRRGGEALDLPPDADHPGDIRGPRVVLVNHRRLRRTHRLAVEATPLVWSRLGSRVGSLVDPDRDVAAADAAVAGGDPIQDAPHGCG